LFVDWKGFEKPLKLSSKLKPSKTMLYDLLFDLHGGIGILFPTAFDSRWTADTAHVITPTVRFTYDTAKLQASVEPNVATKTKEGLAIKQRFQFPDSKIEIRIVTLPSKNEEDEKWPKIRMEILKPGHAPQVILEQKEMLLFKMCVVVPAPNRKFVALHYTGLPLGRDNDREADKRILVINQAGEVVADLDLAK
jgi:hypothetical protein